jgi:putative phage-type endonuclease
MSTKIQIGHAVPLPHTVQGSQAWLDQRREGIGGSDVACLLGPDDPLKQLSKSPWSGPHSVYASKVNGVDSEETVAMRCGHALEGLCLELLAEDANLEILTDCGGMAHHPEYPWARGSIDGAVYRIVVEVDGVEVVEVYAGAEAKTSSDYAWSEVPIYYLVQVQWYLWVYGLPRWYVGCIHGKNKFDWWIIEADPVIQAELFKAARDFWWDHVIPECPPPVDWSADCLSNLMAGRTLKDDKSRSPLPEALDLLVGELEEVKGEIKRSQGRKGRISNAIMAELPAKRCEGTRHNVTLVQREGLDRNALAAEHPEEYRACFVPQPSAFSVREAKARYPELVSRYTGPSGNPSIKVTERKGEP